MIWTIASWRYKTRLEFYDRDPTGLLVNVRVKAANSWTLILDPKGTINMRKLIGVLNGVAAILLASTTAMGQSLVPPKDVRLTCAPLPYVFDCSISRLPNPQFTSRCFYVADDQSTLMRADHRMGFSNEIVKLKVNAGLAITGVVTEAQTGKQADCEEEAN